MTTDTAAAAAAIPGLVVRPYAGEADLPEIVRLTNADLAHDGVREHFTLDDFAATFRHPSDSFDAARDVLMAEIDGRAVGTVRVDWVDASDGTREYRSRGSVDPIHRRRGIGRRLLAAGEELIRANAARHDTARPRVVGMFVDELQVARSALARGAGYEPVRWFFVMERAGVDVDLPDLLSLPDGLDVRPATRDDARAIWEADHEAFQDHWGGWDMSDASFLRWIESPEFQPEVAVVAWDGDEIAGAVLNAIYAEENKALGLRRGWLDSVFTRRAWRGRGLARALIGRSLRLLAERGMDTAALGVDADNPSGALGLYESSGFIVVDRGAAWRRPLEEVS
jgi:mycothiol synthase